MKPNLTTLRCLPIFSALTESDVIKIIDSSEFISFNKKAVIVKQNEASGHVYFILSGYVKVTRGGNLSVKSSVDDRRVKRRKEIALAVLGPGDVIGELATLTDLQRSASIVSISPCELLKIDNATFLKCVNDHPSVAMYVLKHLAKRLVTADLQIELFRAGVEARVYALIRNMKNIGLPQDLYPSNAEIARMVGATREMVSKVMRNIEKDDKKLSIVN